jgi:hypothetical protein
VTENPEEREGVYPLAGWTPIPNSLIDDMRLLQAESLKCFVWLSYRRWDATERALSEGRDRGDEEGASPLREVADATGLSDGMATHTLEAMQQRGYVRETPAGWLLIAYTEDVPAG